MIKKLFSGLEEFVFPEGSDIQAEAFNILAVCGIIVSMLTALFNLRLRFGTVSVLGCLSGAFFSLGMILYTRRTGHYRSATVLTVLVIFLGLFTFLFFKNGGYEGGVPYFFVFAAVFTAFLLDGAVMLFLLAVELLWYAFLFLYPLYNTSPSLNSKTGEYVLDIVICETLVSISLAATMYLQIRLYRKKQKEMNKAVLSAEEANRAKSDFLAKMSHDIRTPLNTIMAVNELIVSNTSSARIREWVNDSNLSGRLLISLIDDMLDLTRIEAGRIDLAEQPIDTATFFQEIARVWRRQAEKAGIGFSFVFDEGMPSFLLGDEAMLRKITDNLLSNAVKYTKEGSVRLSVSWDGELGIEVADTGIGIAPEFLDTIFKPFERGSQDIYRETSGSGLGLTIVRELVDAMQGRIECRSVPGEGTVFTLRLPQKEYSGQIEDRPEMNRGTFSGGRHEKRFVAPDARILVVDDNPYNRRVLEYFLEPTLIRVDDVESGYEALEMIDIREYDLILMDLRMPKMDGLETLERIRKEYPGFHTPVVALTADIMNGIEERLIQEGFSGFLAKPVNSARLFETLSGFISGKTVVLEAEDDNGLTLGEVERYHGLLMPYGINLKLALENNAGNSCEFLTRAALFEKYAGEGMEQLKKMESMDSFYIQIHSLKSAARGIGAWLLSELAETIEFRKDDTYAENAVPLLLEEYRRVCIGLIKLREEVNSENETEKGHDH